MAVPQQTWHRQLLGRAEWRCHMNLFIAIIKNVVKHSLLDVNYGKLVSEEYKIIYRDSVSDSWNEGMRPGSYTRYRRARYFKKTVNLGDFIFVVAVHQEPFTQGAQVIYAIGFTCHISVGVLSSP